MIDERLIGTYITELDALRRHGTDFAKAYPDIASRLDIGSEHSTDPAVERFVQSAAFLSARLRMLIERSTEELPMALLTMIAPVLLDPVPAFALASLQGGTEVETIPKDTLFEYEVGGQALLRFATTMETSTAPARLSVRRLAPGPVGVDGLSIQVHGKAPEQLMVYLGRDQLTAAQLIDALSKDLARLEVMHPDAKRATVLPAHALRFHGYTRNEAALPHRAASHPGHRLVTEFLSFPDKFRFVSVNVPGLASGSEIRFWFARPLPLSRTEMPVDGLFSLNRIPLINLWPTVAVPFDMSGRALEYPVRIDPQRYRYVECHSVEHVDLFLGGKSRAERIDPLVGVGRRSESSIEWGVRRTLARAGSEVMLYFRGPGYARLGVEKILVSPQVYASNGSLCEIARAGTSLIPARSIGDWNASLASMPSRYRPALHSSQAMTTLLGYLQSSLKGLAGSAAGSTPRVLNQYLRHFPGGEDASWLDALGKLDIRPVLVLRQGQPVPATNVSLRFDQDRARTKSHSTIERVLTALLDAHRGLNHVQDVELVQS